MSAVGWVIIGVSVWVVIAGLVAVVVGKVIARRDRQVPRPQRVDVPDQLPRKRPHGSPAAHRRGRHY